MSKTNIDIIDQDDWNWIKSKKNEFQFRSVSNVVFKMIDEYRSMNLERLIFLKLIEKYFEFDYFDMKELSYQLDLNTESIVKQVDKYLDKKIPLFSLDNKEKVKAISKVHRKMMDNGILPRELSIAYKLKQFIDRNKLNIEKYEDNLENEDIIIRIEANNEIVLSILFPNKEERRKEIYHSTLRVVDWFTNLKDKEFFECNKCDEDCFIKKPDYIYFKSGIEMLQEDIQEDLITDILKSEFNDENVNSYYGFCLALAIDYLIKKNLTMVKNFVEQEIYLFQKPEEFILFINILIKYTRKETESLSKEKDLMEKFYNVVSKEWLSA